MAVGDPQQTSQVPMVSKQQILRMLRKGELSIDDLPPELRDDPQFADMLTQLRGLRQRELATGFGGTLARTAAGAMMPVVPAAAPALSQIAFGTPITPQAPEWDPAARDRASAGEGFKAAIPETAKMIAAEAKIAEAAVTFLPSMTEKVFARMTDVEKNALEASFKKSTLLQNYDLKALDLLIVTQKAAVKASGDADNIVEVRQKVHAKLLGSKDDAGQPMRVPLMEIFNSVAENTEESAHVNRVLEEILSAERNNIPESIKQTLRLSVPKAFINLNETKLRKELDEAHMFVNRGLMSAKSGGREGAEQYLMLVRSGKVEDEEISADQAGAILAQGDRFFHDMEDPAFQKEMIEDMAREAIKVGVPASSLAVELDKVAVGWLGEGATGPDLLKSFQGTMVGIETRETAFEKQEERLMRLEDRMGTKDQPYRTEMQRQQVMENPELRGKLARAAESFGLGTDAKTLDDVYKAFTTGYKHHEAKKVQATPSVLSGIARGKSRDSVLSGLTAKKNANEGKQRQKRRDVANISPGGGIEADDKTGDTSSIV